MINNKDLILDDADQVKFIKRTVRGSNGQTETYHYEILDTQGNKKGSAQYTEHTNLNGLQISCRTTQEDLSRNVIVQKTECF